MRPLLNTASAQAAQVVQRDQNIRGQRGVVVEVRVTDPMRHPRHPPPEEMPSAHDQFKLDVFVDVVIAIVGAEQVAAKERLRDDERNGEYE